MTHYYSDPEREREPTALPDVEVFRSEPTGDDAEGWYWWCCQPGCLPDSDPWGPFESEAAALADARAYMPL